MTGSFHVLYKIIVGVVGGVVVGDLIARFIFGRPASTQLARVMEGAEALAATLMTYAVTELVSGYGFIAVFVAALVLRNYE
jgi:NhaP-type Na+/H+ and K+/H+ antiporter